MKKIFIAFCLFGVSAAQAECPDFGGKYSCRTEDGRVYEQELKMFVTESGLDGISIVSDGVDYGDILLDREVHTSTETVNGLTYVHEARAGCLPVVDVIHIVRSTTVKETQSSTRLILTLYGQDYGVLNAIVRFDAEGNRIGSKDVCMPLEK